MTNGSGSDSISELSARAGARKTAAKKFEKERKKFLTNGKARGKISKLTARAESKKAVPCKLNNVKNEPRNTLDNYGLFKRKRKNSQRKFLSNIARSKLFKNLI